MTFSKRIGNSIFTVYFDDKNKKPAGLINTIVDEKSEFVCADKIPIKECKDLVELLFNMGL